MQYLCPWGEWGHLDLLWFPVTQICVGLRPSIHLCPSACVRLSLHNISYSFSSMAFKFSNMLTTEKTLNEFTFHDYGSVFKVKRGHYVSKLTLFMQYFL